MDAIEAIFLLRRIGLTLTTDGESLLVKPADLLDDDTRWLIRSHKAALIAELLDDSPAWAWLVHHSTHSVETYHHPERTRAQVMQAYPNAVAVEKLPECMWPHDPNKGEHPHVDA